MKIKMKLLLLCAAVAPFLMMTSIQQNGSRFGCVCAIEKFPKSTIGSGENCRSTSHKNKKVVPNDWKELWVKFFKNYKILKDYSAETDTPVYHYFYVYRYFNKIYNYVYDLRNSYKEQSMANSWREYYFVSAVLEGILESRGQKFESVECYINPNLSKAFPFYEFKELTASLYRRLGAFPLKLHYFYRSFAYLMHCLDSKSFNDLIVRLEAVPYPYMQLFIAGLINLAYVVDADVNLNKLYNTLRQNAHQNMNSESVFKSILSCFGFEEKLCQTLLRFYSTFSKFLNACSSDYYLDEAVSWFNYLGSLRDVDAINSFVDEFNIYIDDLERELTISDSDCTDK